jgi:sugar lactone lactonase YvrE
MSLCILSPIHVCQQGGAGKRGKAKGLGRDMKHVLRVMPFIISFCMLSSPVPAFSQEAYKFDLMWGSGGTGEGQFTSPVGIAVDASGNVYVADTGNSRIQEFDPNGNFIRKWGSEGTGDGQFSYPEGVAIDSSGRIYVADTSNHRIQKFDSNGDFFTKWGSEGAGDRQFKFPVEVAVDGSGNIFVSDTENNRIQKFDSSGNLITKWGFPGKPQSYNDGSPQGISVDSSGNVYVIVYRGTVTFILPPPPVPVIQKFDSNGNFITEWPLWALEAERVAADPSGDVFVADSTYGNSRVRKFDPDGNLFTEWGSWGQGQGQFDRPGGVAVDSAGNVYVADTYNHRIQKFSPTGQELVSVPNPPVGPFHGVPGVSYSYSTGGSVSDHGHPVEYRFDWGDGTFSDWSSSPNASKSWGFTGSYLVKTQARCATDPSVVSCWSNLDTWYPANVNIFWIDLLSPLNYAQFGPCSLYSPVTFFWDADDSFVSYEVHFSGMTGIPIKVPASAIEIVIPPEIWGQIVRGSGPAGTGTIYWWVTGTRSDGTTESSNGGNFQIVSQPVGNPNVSPTGRRSKTTLTWQSNCNTKFIVCFGADTNFTKKTTFTFNIKDPTVEAFSKTLNPVQWMAVKRLVKNKAGSTIYWEVYSSNGLGGAKTDVMSFVLTD